MSLALRVPRAAVTLAGLVLLLSGAIAPPAHAQRLTRTASIDPGMTRDQVMNRLGSPSSESHFGSFTYLFYDNGCGTKCGTDDVVILDKNIVTDAIFRSPQRTFTGVSSSPESLPPVASEHYAPEPIHAATSDDSAHRGGIVFAEPRSPMQPPRYTRIVPTHADSARVPQMRAEPADTVGTPRADSTSPPH